MNKSFICVGLGLLYLIIFGRHNLDLMMTGFAFVQLMMGLICFCLILLRITRLLINKSTGFYYFSGTFQAGLSIIDVILLLSNQRLIKSSLLVFLVMNSMLAFVIFYDIYKPRSKRHKKSNLQFNRPFDRKDRKSIYGASVEQRSEALPENVD